MEDTATVAGTEIGGKELEEQTKTRVSLRVIFYI